MRSRTTRTVFVAVSVPLLAGAFAAPAMAAPRAAAHPAATASHTAVVGGRTTLTVATGVAAALASAGIRPAAIDPATQAAVHTSTGPTVRYAFPITSGSVDLDTVTGVIGHSGGLRFTNVNNGSSLSVRGFRIVLGGTAKVTGYVLALGVRIPVFAGGLRVGTAAVMARLGS